MNSLVCVSQILATFLLQLRLVQASTSLSKTHSKVMLFHEAWGRSLCRSLERMVEVEQEYPGGVEHIFNPGCVPLQRCSGCCNDDKLECSPILTQNVTIQLLRITPADLTREYVLLSFLEHHSCECRPRRTLLRNKSKHRLSAWHKGRKGRRRSDCGKCRQPRG